MKKNIPTARLLMCCSWASVALGCVAAISSILSGGMTARSFGVGVFIFMGSLVVALVLRVLAIIGQLFFELNSGLFAILQTHCREVARHHEEIHKKIIEHHKETLRYYENIMKYYNAASPQDVLKHHQTMAENSEALRSILDQVGCDAKDMNQSLHEMKEFLLKLKHHIETQQG